MPPHRHPLPTVLIVEDEFLVALDLESIAIEAGYLPVGTAPDRATAYALPVPHIALIDLNLRDGATGVAIARELSRQGAKIIYLTANPAQIGEPAPNAIGVVQKPYSAGAGLRQQRRTDAGGVVRFHPAKRCRLSVSPHRRLRDARGHHRARSRPDEFECTA